MYFSVLKGLNLQRWDLLDNRIFSWAFSCESFLTFYYHTCLLNLLWPMDRVLTDLSRHLLLLIEPQQPMKQAMKRRLPTTMK